MTNEISKFDDIIDSRDVIARIATPPSNFTYSRWRHGGWYVHGVRYSNGAIGCVTRNFTDRKWRIACDPRPFNEQPTFKSRDDAALAEWYLANEDGRP